MWAEVIVCIDMQIFLIGRKNVNAILNSRKNGQQKMKTLSVYFNFNTASVRDFYLVLSKFKGRAN